MKIVFFDPHLDEVGHYKYFNWHLAKLLDFPGNEIIFVDYSDSKYFKNWYKDNKLCHATFSFSEVSPLRDSKYSLGRTLMARVIFRSIWWSQTLKTIESLGADYIIFTSEPDRVIFPSKVKTKHAIVVHRIDPLVQKEGTLPGVGYCTEDFVKNANKAIVLEKYLMEKASEFGYDSFFVPYQLYDEVPHQAHRALNKQLTIGTVGAIYEGKNLEFILNVIRDVNDKKDIDFKYILAGQPLDEYGRHIRQLSTSLEAPNLQLDFSYLSEEKYTEYIREMDYVVLPYSEDRQNRTSGVLFDALNMGKPFIAPAIEPFKTYADEYGVGLLYEPNNIQSFIDVVNRAKDYNQQNWSDAINKLNAQRTYDRWKGPFQESLF